jgi:hypothetical protein
MSAEQLVRTAHGGIGDSDIIRVFGRWGGQFVITAHECVLYTISDIGVRQPVDWAAMPKLLGATCVNPGSGIEIGIIADFDNPLHTPSPLSPLVRLTYLGAFPVDSWGPGDAVPSAAIGPGMQIRVPDLNLNGDVIEPVAVRQYLVTKDVTAAVVHFGQDITGCEGAPVLVQGGERDGQLVGMLFNIGSGGGEAVAYCYPAEQF